MKTFSIKAEWIKEIRDGHCIPWNYDYKEYIFNDEYTEGFSIRIPKNTNGIKAMEMSNGTGIKDEYEKIFLDNGGKVTSLFDIDEKPDWTKNQGDSETAVCIEHEIEKDESAVTQSKKRICRYTYGCSMNEEKQREVQIMADRIFKYGKIIDSFRRDLGHEPPKWWENNGDVTFKVEQFNMVWLVGLTGAMVTGITHLIEY